MNMATLTLPKSGASAASATVLRWFRKVGDSVKKGELLLEAETDAGLIGVESAVEGILRENLAPVGKTMNPGDALAVIDPLGSIGETVPQQLITLEGKSVTKKKAPGGKVIPILMPKAGQSMEEGVIVKWHVSPGAQVTKGTVIFEIETDKATIEIEATDSGRLARIVVPDGGSSVVLKPVAYLAEKDEDVDAYIAEEGDGGAPVEAGVDVPQAVATGLDRDGRTIAPAVTTETGRVKASPAARKFAAERGIDLASIGAGSGPEGRILSTDVPKQAPGRPVGSSSLQTGLPAGVVVNRMSNMRKAIARNLTLSKTTIPHWYLRSCVNAGELMSFYRSQKARIGCSVNDVIVMACARAIMEFPLMHSRVDGESIMQFAGANIGIAVGMDDGLVVPVLMHAEKLTLADLAMETKRLASQARAGKIENMGMGVFTISNLGMYGVEDFVAIVNPPEAAILAVGAVHEAVVVKDGAMRPGQQLNLTLSADHRLIDGTLGAQFMARLKAILENPSQLIS